MKKKREHRKESMKALKRETKKLSIEEGIGYSVMDGAGLRYITPYALSLGANNAQIGFLTSIPSLLGNFFQLFTFKAIKKTSRKKVILAGVLLQALMWLPLLAVGYLFFFRNLDHNISSILIIILYTLLTIFGSFISPAWNSLMKDVVGKGTGTYFGNRNKILGTVALLAMLIAGLMLNYFGKINLFLGFAILFGIAFASRLISWNLLRKHYEPRLKIKQDTYFNFWQFIKRIPQSNFGKFTVLISLIMLATSIASPFFSVYMLKHLRFNYMIWALIIFSSSLSSLLSMPLWGKFADKFGNLKVLRFTGAFIPLVPLAWFLTPLILKIDATSVIVYLFSVEFISGFIWAGFNLSSVNFIYDAVSRQKLSLCVAYYNILHGIGVFVGASLGGIISSSDFVILGMNSILVIFLISAVARFAVYIVMISKIKEVRRVEKYKDGELKKEIIERLISSSNKLVRRPMPTPF